MSSPEEKIQQFTTENTIQTVTLFCGIPAIAPPRPSPASS